MSFKGSSGEGGRSPFNITTFLALLTLLGGVALSSKRLQTSRPLARVDLPTPAIGDQTEEARFWDDPLRDLGSSTKSSVSQAEVRAQLAARLHEGAWPGGPSNLMLMPVLVSGMPYGEDRESRIRSRFAVISGLAVEGYAPEDSGHLGTAWMDWSTTSELEAWKELGGALGSAACCDGFAGTAGFRSGSLGFRFEWFRRRYFVPPSKYDHFGHVLVVWLDEALFEDDLATRMALFTHALWPELADQTETNAPATVRVIGPRSSTTLRTVLLPYLGKKDEGLEAEGARLGGLVVARRAPGEPSDRVTVRDLLRRVDLHCPTASAIDEALLPDSGLEPVREVVRKCLRHLGFHEARFYACDEGLLAREILDELGLRGVDATAGQQHIVFISEGDTFFGRVMALTYASEMMTLRKRFTNATLFIREYRERGLGFPSNLHHYTYLRGLDGQTTQNKTKSDGNARDSARAHPRTFEELAVWTPDENRSEGEAQFDYLSRLGDEIQRLDEKLRHASPPGRVRAIGIGGSDTYDTLLILQALRGRFPGALFFTTELDSRFTAPEEAAWARNLIVAGGYGLALGDKLQRSVPPFRDGQQTAIFSSVLAALNNPEVPAESKVLARRFEIGHRRAVDLSVTPSSAPAGSWAQDGRSANSWWFPCLLILGSGWYLGCRLFPWFSNHTVGCLAYAEEVLGYGPEDLGGDPTKEALGELHRLADEALPGLPGAGRPAERAGEGEGVQDAEEFADRLNALLQMGASRTSHGQGDGEPARLILGLAAFLRRFLERLARLPTRPSSGAQPRGWLVRCSDRPRTLWRQLRSPFKAGWIAGRKGLWPLAAARQRLDRVLSRVSRSRLDVDAWRRGRDARYASRHWFETRALGIASFWLGGALVLALAFSFGGLVWWDATVNEAGEPFSLWGGVSAWPAEVIRFAACILAAVFSLVVVLELRGSFFALTRKYRFSPGFAGGGWGLTGSGETAVAHAAGPISPASSMGSWGEADAERLWYELYDNGRVSRRAERAMRLVFVYLLFGVGVFMLGGVAASPVRGKLLADSAPAPFLVVVMGVGLLIASVFSLRRIRERLWLIITPICVVGLMYLPHWLNGRTSLADFPALDTILQWGAISGFLFLTFLVIDTALRCRDFIVAIAHRPTRYPESTRQHFSKLRATSDTGLLDEWIDVQIIADLTERIGSVLWFPSIIFLMQLLARTQWWDRWQWTTSLVVITVTNFLAVMLCILIVQHAARDAKQEAERVLANKVHQARAAAAPSAAVHSANQAEQLLDEIRDVNRGAFVGFWQNPVVGALLVPSGGTVLVELSVWLLGR